MIVSVSLRTTTPILKILCISTGPNNPLAWPWEMAESNIIWHTGRVRSTQALKQMERRIENYIHIIRYALEKKLSLILPSSDTKKERKTQSINVEKIKGWDTSTSSPCSILWVHHHLHPTDSTGPRHHLHPLISHSLCSLWPASLVPFPLLRL